MLKRVFEPSTLYEAPLLYQKIPTLRDIISDLKAAWLFILSGAALGLMLSVLFLFLAVPHYRAVMTVSPANPLNGAEVSSLLANDNLFALRFLVQRVGVTNSSDFLRFEQMIKGQTIADALLKDPQIIEGLKNDHQSRIKIGGNNVKWNAPLLADYLRDRVRFQPVGGTSLHEMSYFHADPNFAVYFLQQLHDLTDNHIRQTIRREAEERVSYLKGAIDAEKNPEHRRTLTTLLLEQERLRMLVSIDQPYAAAITEAPAHSHKPKWPNVPLVFVVSILGFALLGYAAHGLRRD